MPQKPHRSFNFTKTALEQLELPKTGKELFHDTVCNGLVIQVHSGGSKTFHVYKKSPVTGKPIRPKIGRFPDISVETARKEAAKLLSEIALGRDPAQETALKRGEITLGKLFATYVQSYAREHCKRWEETEKNFNRYFQPWLDRRATSFTLAEVQNYIHRLGQTRSKHVANRAFDDLRGVFSWGVKYGYVQGANPCIGVVKYKTQARERFIAPEEFETFFEELKAETNEAFRDYVYLSLFTGARQANVLAMRWEQVDFDLAHWHIPGETMKNQQSQTVPLTALALQVLVDRHARRTSDQWVFPSDGASGHYVEPKNAWRKFLKRAKLSNLTMHDLRRTLGSYMAMNNQSLHIIGKVLGHRSPSSTLIYSRLANDPLRNAMEGAIAKMLPDSSAKRSRAKREPRNK